MKKHKKNSSLRAQDPYLERESATYENPLPSREYLLDLMREHGAPVKAEELIDWLDIAEDERDHFMRRLRAMQRDGQIMRNRKNALCLVEKLDLIPGRVQGHADGFGFLVPDAGGPDLFLGPREMDLVLHNDRAVVRETGLDRRGRREGAVVEVLERANHHLVGRLHEDQGVLYVVAEDRRISQDILVLPGGAGGAQTGQIVMVEIITQPDRKSQPIGRVTEVLGHYADPGMEIEIALRKHKLPHEFSTEAMREAQAYGDAVTEKDWAGREDIRDLPLVTIDGETARDFDDAVYCSPEGKGFRLVVAIADVSHYVKPGMVLDREAYERGNSVYFPRRVIPMLPEELSNGLCSINPDVNRLCMACDMSIDARGQIKRYRFYPAVMRSHARLTYTEVAAVLADESGAAAKQRQALLPQLKALKALFDKLLEAREKRGAIDFETSETVLVFTDQGKIERIEESVRNEAHRIIEECMLAANVCAAEFLLEHQHPALYRVHEGPTPEKLDNLRAFLSEFGLGLKGGDKPRAGDYAKLLDTIRSRPDAQLLQTVMLRSLSQAVYSPDNTGHFGLSYDAYTHFTSPIRRYPDLLVHRAIKAVLKQQQYRPGKWAEIGTHCSMTERRADDATRDVVAWLKCFYMQDRVGESFDGTISAVTGFGLFVSLDAVYVEGLLHISELGNDYYHFDQQRHMLIGERGGNSYRLGERIRVRIVRVDMETTKIDFVLDEDA